MHEEERPSTRKISGGTRREEREELLPERGFVRRPLEDRRGRADESGCPESRERERRTEEDSRIRGNGDATTKTTTATTARTYAPSLAASGRRDFMFTNFIKPGNDALDRNRRPIVAESAMPASSRPRRGTRRRRRAVARLGEILRHDGSRDRGRKGGNGAATTGTYRSRDRRHARRAFPSTGAGGPQAGVG